MSTRLPPALEAAIYSSLSNSSSEDLEERCRAVLKKAADPLALHVGLDADHIKISQAAESLRKEASDIVQKYDLNAALRWLNGNFSIVVEGRSNKSRELRIMDMGWWRRVIKKSVYKSRERAWILGAPLFIRYCSPDAQNSLALEDYATGVSIRKRKLSLSSGSITSREEREQRQYAEALARARGISDFAHSHGCFSARLITITVPPHMHPTATSKGRVRRINTGWDHTMPDEANGWLQSRWSTFRSAVDREGVKLYWILAVHPHTDSTPHWHMVAWSTTSDWEVISGLLSKYFSISTSGCADHTYSVKTNYIGDDCLNVTAYIFKNMSSRAAGRNGGNEESFNASAWARTWGIRRIRFCNDRVSVYRELRKCSTGDEELSEITKAAKKGDYGEFLKLAEEHDINPVYGLTTNRFEEMVNRVIGVKVGGGYPLNACSPCSTGRLMKVVRTVITEETSRHNEIMRLPWVYCLTGLHGRNISIEFIVSRARGPPCLFVG